MINIGEIEVYGDAAMTPCTDTANGDGKTAAKAGLTCKTIKQNFPSSTSGEYYRWNVDTGR